MRLLSLTLRNFRGFGSSVSSIELDADLILLYGPNGFGKTSLAEAVEWLLYGTTRRRKRGDAYSKNEYDGCFGNVHGATPIEVAARLRLSNGAEHMIARRIPDPRNDTVSTTYVDDKPSKFDHLGLSETEPALPVIAQHDLQSFIHSRPKERRDLISAALGLDEVTALKAALDSARRSFTNAPPKEVEESRANLRPLAPSLAGLADTKALAQRWQKPNVDVRIEEDLKALTCAAQKLAASAETERESLIQALRVRRQQLSENVFDISPLQLPSDITTTVQRLNAEKTNLSQKCIALAENIAKCIASAASTYATLLLQFWDSGLKLSPDGDHCPMCEAPTLTLQKRELLRARLQAAQAALTSSKEVATAKSTAETALTRLRQALETAAIPGITDARRQLLQQLFEKNPQPLSLFLHAYDKYMAAVTEGLVAGKATSAFLRDMTEKLADTTRAPELLAESNSIPHRLDVAAQRSAEELTAYGQAWTVFERQISILVSSNQEIAQIDAVGKALKAEPSLRSLASFDKICAGSLTLIQSTEAYLQAKQTEMLVSRGKEIKEIYDQMNPGAEVCFENMEPGTDQLKLHATSFGVRMSAAANLSECQLNCLGLSFWLGRATMTDSPFGFIMLDDPVQSMDDDHCEAFLGSVVPMLCDKHGKQVLVLSHQKKLIDRIRDTNKSREVAVYHFDIYEKTGPSITQQINLAIMLREIEGLSKGNEANRCVAVDKLRKVGEQFIRELHLRQTGMPAPANYDDAQPAELLELFRLIPGTTPDEFQRLKDTMDFGSPAHHQGVGYVVPVTTNIRPHIDRLRTLMRHFKLLK